ncbi:transcription initiation factor TFIID 127kD subunit [Plectosphaerella plurivora]|uniref:Transcription initiation factor TFIID subunit 2 n=1 Tax=Plectosphaerella plurivora TaxID=936078 RepID=A0A9P8VEA6_9PEZI|nr:transcription initiation factor TFIID 127kD subunit [Plectosphaerella plurivora]
MSPIALPSQASSGLVRIKTSTEDGLPPPETRKMLPYAVIRQEVDLEVNFREKRISGKSEIIVAGIRDSDDEDIEIDARQAEIDVNNIEVEVLRNSKPLGPPKKIPATYRDPYELLDYPKNFNWTAEHHDVRRLRMRPLIYGRGEAAVGNRDTTGCMPSDGSIRISAKHLIKLREEILAAVPKRPGIKLRLSSNTASLAADTEESTTKEYRITIPFVTKRIRDGLQFVGVDPGDLKWPHVYTRHSIEPGTASCIFPCIDDHGQKCNWRISLKFPRTLGDALRQPLATQNGTNGRAGTGGRKIQQMDDNDLAISEEDKILEMNAICSGVVIEETVDPTDDTKKIVRFEVDKPVSVQKLGFAIGPFETVNVSAAFRPEADDEKLGLSALKVQAFCLPGRADEAMNTCQTLPSAADFFTLTFARYPYDEYRVCFVDDMVEDTVSLQWLSFVSTRLLYPDNVLDPDAEVGVSRKVVQSLASQWSGVNLVPNKKEDLWVTVGISYYMTDLYLRKLCGNNDYRFRMKTMADELIERDFNRPSLHDLGRHAHIGDFEMDFMTLKAPLVLFILDKRLMKAPAQTNLTRILSILLYQANTSGKSADEYVSTQSFRRICEKYSKGKFETFWKQWIFGSGCPKFDVTQKFNKKKLCVEMLVRQVQIKEAKQNVPIDKHDFLRLVKERQYNVVGEGTQPWFTGPMTIRIHEADGTPYEHIVEVREDAAAARQCKYDIPYNTKYKRLKRSRRQRDRAVAQSHADGENADDSLLYCLGDVLQNQEDVQNWDLLDWPAEMERRMDQESYEWIRMDADFEWICTMKTNSESYMYVSQLQQDRDVVAQQDTMLYLGRSPAHPLVSSILTRTLVDRRYFHGIRTMACSQLYRHSVASHKDPMIGLYHLLRTFSELCCFPDTHMPRPNDFSDRKQYLARSAIPLAVAKVRDANGRCPQRARQFLLDQIKYNNNANNAYSDNFYVAKLLQALATSLIPDKRPDGEVQLDEIRQTQEEEDFLAEALTEIDRYRRMDEWANSYHNIWTVTALDCKQRLMKASVIPRDGLDFVQYLQDDTYDLVRIKAFEALVDLGFMLEEAVFCHLLRTMSTDKSPFVRRQLLKVFSIGLAGLAIGEFSKPKEQPRLMDIDGPTDIFGEDPKDDMLVVESGDTAGDKETRERHVEAARKHDLAVALEALKKEIKEQFPQQMVAIGRTVWNAIDQDTMGRVEKTTLLEFCSMMFDAADEWVMTFTLPQKWKVVRPPQHHPKRLIVTFTPYYVLPKKTVVVEPPPIPALPPPPSIPVTAPVVIPAPVATPTGEPKRLIVSAKIKTSKPAVSAKHTPLPTGRPVAPVKPVIPVRRDSLGVSQPKAPQPKAPSVPPVARPTVTVPPSRSDGDSIVAQTPVRIVGLATPSTSQSRPDGSHKLHKRPRPDKVNGDDGASPVAKRPKIHSKHPTNGDRPRRKMFTFRSPILRRWLIKNGFDKRHHSGDSVQVARKHDTGSARASPAPSLKSNYDSIHAKPGRKPLPGSPVVISSGHSSHKASASPAPSSHSGPSQASPPPRDVNGQQPAAAPKRPKIVLKRPGSNVQPPPPTR